MKPSVNFKQVVNELFPVLAKYVPVVDRVHETHHPEFHTVKAVFEQIYKKVCNAKEGQADLEAEFIQLREVTFNYAIPGDVCETFAAVYQMLETTDQAYHL